MTLFLVEGLRETFRDFVQWIQEFPQRSGVRNKYERWLLWIALGFLALVYSVAWLG
jgi:hypothetical protein